jgi:energy-coupling factor transporter ATP-binding protein EcfA2
VLVRRVIAEGVGPFEHLNLELREGKDPDRADVHLLVGPNGCGKSTVLRIIASAFGDASPATWARLWDRSSYAAVETEGGWGVLGRPPPHGASHQVPDANWVRSGSEDGAQPQVQSPSRLMDLQRRLAGNRRRAAGHTVGFAAFAYSNYRSTETASLAAVREIESPPHDGALSFSERPGSEDVVQWIANTLAKWALDKADGDDVKAARRRHTLDAVEQAVANIIGEPVRFRLLRDPLAVRLVLADQELPFDVLPDGVKSILSWIADLLMRLERTPWEGDVPVLERPFLLLLDEIEVHLHPKWQRRVVPVIERLFPRAQVILSTHSPFIVASAADAWTYQFRVDRGRASHVGTYPSKVGSSVSALLREVFDVDGEFDVGTEARLDELYALRDRLLAGDEGAREAFDKATQALARTSEELRDIVVYEQRSLARRLRAS